MVWGEWDRFQQRRGMKTRPHEWSCERFCFFVFNHISFFAVPELGS